jgi:hypothetical protein
VDPQQHAVKIAQFGPADIARQQTQPPGYHGQTRG